MRWLIKEFSRQLVLAVVVFVVVVLFSFTNLLFAHEWYDKNCCDDRDCKPSPEGSVKVTQQGYLVYPQNGLERPVLVPFRDERIKGSADNGYHTCVVSSEMSKDGWIRCLYVPPVAF